jgi:hypothetical protein
MDIQMEPTKADLENHKFCAWIKATYGGVKPDPQDYPTMTPNDEKRASVDDEYAAYQYRLALTNKVIRLWREWQSKQA